MPKLPSDKTLLAHAKRQIRLMEQEITQLRHELIATRGRATQAETRAREWEDRFDELLAAFKRPASSPAAVAEKL